MKNRILNRWKASCCVFGKSGVSVSIYREPKAIPNQLPSNILNDRFFLLGERSILGQARYTYATADAMPIFPEA